MDQLPENLLTPARARAAKWREDAERQTMLTGGQRAIYLACAAEVEAAPALQSSGGEVVAWVGDMKTSAGMEYYVCVGRPGGKFGDGYLTPHMYRIRGRAEYDVAEWNHLLNGGPKPDILAFDTDESATASPAQPSGFVLVPVERGLDERVNDDSFRALVHGFRSQIGARRPSDSDPEDQWAWDKATDLLALLLTAAPAPIEQEG